MDISAEMVRKLREETGAGMMDCKSALAESGGDMEKARDTLRNLHRVWQRPVHLPLINGGNATSTP